MDRRGGLASAWMVEPSEAVAQNFENIPDQTLSYYRLPHSAGVWSPSRPLDPFRQDRTVDSYSTLAECPITDRWAKAEIASDGFGQL